MRDTWLPLSSINARETVRMHNQLVQISPHAANVFAIRVTPRGARLLDGFAYCIEFLVDGNLVLKKWINKEDRNPVIIFDSHKKDGLLYSLALFPTSDDPSLSVQTDTGNTRVEIKITKNEFIRTEIRPEDPPSNTGTLSLDVKPSVAPETSKYVGFKIGAISPVEYKDPNHNKPRPVKLWTYLPETSHTWKIHLCNVITMVNKCRDLGVCLDSFVLNYYEENSVLGELVKKEPEIQVKLEDTDEPRAKKLKKPWDEWDASEVAHWITSLDPEWTKFGLLFKANEIAGHVLPKLDSTDLKDLGIALLAHRVRILAAIKDLQK